MQQQKHRTAARRRLMARLLLFGFVLAFSCAAIPASALQPTYQLSAEYQAGPYYQNLINLVLTGNEANDVVMVALSQLGYHEGNSDADFAGLNESGNRNFVEYNRLSGKVDNGEGNGVSYGYAWCAAFTTWCLRQAGVPVSRAGAYISTSRWVDEYFKVNHTWYPSKAAGGDHAPETGDIIFFKDAKSTRSATHVGIVRYSDGANVYTVEGNSGGCVSLHSYALTDPYISGYGTPKYQSNGYITYDYSEQKGHVAGTYIVTASVLNVRTGPGTSYAADGQLTRGQTIFAEDFSSGFAVYHTADGSARYVSASYLTFVAGVPLPTYQIRYEIGNAGGRIVNQTKTKGYDITLSRNAPFLFGQDFLGWTTEENPTADSVPLYQPSDVYSVDADLTLYPIFAPHIYTVSFYDADGTTLIGETTCLYREIPTSPEVPVFEKDGLYYLFAGWDRELSEVKEDGVSYTATYTTSETAPETEPPEVPTETISATSPAESGTQEKGCTGVLNVRTVLPVVLLLFPAVFALYKKSYGKDQTANHETR